MAVQRIEIDAESLAGEIGSMSANELDALPFGAIQLDEEGVVLSYNKAEEKISGRKASEVVGKHFFRDVAPCTRVKRFFGAFQAGVERRELNEVFDFTFRFPTGPREVRIRMIYSRAAVWIFVTPL
ncbi:MAG TPA: PAS domain-containing protein [Thermoanaerobaculia bacterium]|nr:PAS domain-containing protein [Thermoanaerobaculia bacterium]